MSKVNLCDICDFQGGSQPPKSQWITLQQDGYIRMLQIRDFTQPGKVKAEYVKLTNTTKCCLKDDILIARYGASLGKILTGLSGAYNVAMTKAVPNEAVISKKFLYYFLCSDTFQNCILNVGVRAAQAGFNKEDLSNIELYCPDLSIQNKICKILELVDVLINKSKLQLDELDLLVKSRFIEMFGDPITNTKRWPADKVEAVCSNIYGGGTPSKSKEEYWNGDIPWISSKDMKSDMISDSQIRITNLGLDNSSAKLVPINSVIMVIRSGILKHTLPVAINTVPVTVNQDLKVFIPSASIHYRFLAFLFKMLEKDILAGVRAVTADNIEFDTLKNRKIILPPVQLQNQFASFVTQVDKSKFVVTAKFQ